VVWNGVTNPGNRETSGYQNRGGVKELGTVIRGEKTGISAAWPGSLKSGFAATDGEGPEEMRGSLRSAVAKRRVAGRKGGAREGETPGASKKEEKPKKEPTELFRCGGAVRMTVRLFFNPGPSRESSGR